LRLLGSCNCDRPLPTAVRQHQPRRAMRPAVLVALALAAAAAAPRGADALAWRLFAGRCAIVAGLLSAPPLRRACARTRLDSRRPPPPPPPPITSAEPNPHTPTTPPSTAPREECIGEWIPERDWAAVTAAGQAEARVYADVGFVVSRCGGLGAVPNLEPAPPRGRSKPPKLALNTRSNPPERALSERVLSPQNWLL
jgi:hypothetical protein